MPDYQLVLRMFLELPEELWDGLVDRYLDELAEIMTEDDEDGRGR